MSKPATLPAPGPLLPDPARPSMSGGLPLPLDELTTIVRDVAADEARWRPRVRFGNAERWWTRLEAAATHDVWLLTWTTDSATDLHDHGSSTAAFTVVAGTLDELRVDRHATDGTSALARTPLPVGATRAMARGQVHDVRNPYAEPAVSVHAYSPPLTRMTYYRLRSGRLRAVRAVASHEPEARLQ